MSFVSKSMILKSAACNVLSILWATYGSCSLSMTLSVTIKALACEQCLGLSLYYMLVPPLRQIHFLFPIKVLVHKPDGGTNRLTSILHSQHCMNPPGFNTRYISFSTSGHSLAFIDIINILKFTRSNVLSGKGKPSKASRTWKVTFAGRMLLGNRSKISMP